MNFRSRKKSLRKCRFNKRKVKQFISEMNGLVIFNFIILVILYVYPRFKYYSIRNFLKYLKKIIVCTNNISIFIYRLNDDTVELKLNNFINIFSKL